MKHIFIMNDIKKFHDFEKHIHSIMKEYEYIIKYTHSIQEVKKYIESLQEPSRIYAMGGDGALHHVVQSLVHTQHELVVVPLGTGNDFCRMLTKENNPVNVIKKSLKKNSILIDTLKINDYYYINSACFGIDAIIANHVHDNTSFLIESQSYIPSIIKEVIHFKPVDILIESNNQLLYEGKTVLCTVNNGKYYGGGFPIIPDASINDGYIDICVVEGVKKYKYPLLIKKLLEEKLNSRKEVHYFKEKEVDIFYITYANIDGEEKQMTSCHIEVVPQSIHVVKIDE